jgi:hypothetical protein
MLHHRHLPLHYYLHLLAPDLVYLDNCLCLRRFRLHQHRFLHQVDKCRMHLRFRRNRNRFDRDLHLLGSYRNHLEFHRCRRLVEGRFGILRFGIRMHTLCILFYNFFCRNTIR